MSLASLSTGGMILILKHLLEPDVREILEKTPLLNAFLPELERTLASLEQSRPNQESADDRERDIRSALNELDRKHDTLNRHLYRLFEITVDALPEPKKTAFQEAHDRLFPHGLSVTRMRWVDEAGESTRLAKQVQGDPSLSRMLLEMTLTVEGIERLNGLALAEALIQVGQEMDQKLLELSRLQKGGTSAETEARRLFTRWVSRFVDMSQILLADQSLKLQQVLLEIQRQLDLVPSTTTKEEA